MIQTSLKGRAISDEDESDPHLFGTNEIRPKLCKDFRDLVTDRSASWAHYALHAKTV